MNMLSQNFNRRTRWWRTLSAAGAVLLCATAVFAAELDPAVDQLQEKVPDIPLPPRVIESGPPYIDLWRRALQEGDDDVKRQTCDLLINANEQGMAGLDVLLPAVADQLDDDDASQLLKHSAALTLMAFDYRQAADAIDQLNATDHAFIVLATDEALARWGTEPAEQRWLQRLQAADTQTSVRRSAARCLGIVRSEEAVEPLLKVLRSPGSVLVMRIVAAESLGAIRNRGMLADARKLAERGAASQLMAADLVRRDGSPPAVQLLQGLARSDHGVVRAKALTALHEQGEAVREAAAAVAADNVNHRDPIVRFAALRILDAHGSAEAIRAIATRLSDEHPQVRQEARAYLRAHAEASAQHRTLVAQLISDLLKNGSTAWQGVEQAGLLAGELDVEPLMATLMTLGSGHARHESRIACVVGVRKLAVEDSGADMLAIADAKMNRLKAAAAALSPADATPADRAAVQHQQREMTQWILALGVIRHAEGLPLYRQGIPKSANENLGDEVRTACIWAIGRSLQDNEDKRIAGQLASRMKDINSMEPESDAVRRQSAVALGQMKAQSQLKTLDQFYSQRGEGEAIRAACRWAIIQITGKALPPLTPVSRRPRDLFLIPQD